MSYIGVKEQCKKCFHFQVCANVMKNQLLIREKMLKEENPKCEHFVPAENVAEVRRGKWALFAKDIIGKAFICSLCGNVEVTEDFETSPIDNDCNYCSKCGAKMEG